MNANTLRRSTKSPKILGTRGNAHSGKGRLVQKSIDKSRERVSPPYRSKGKSRRQGEYIVTKGVDIRAIKRIMVRSNTCKSIGVKKGQGNKPKRQGFLRKSGKLYVQNRSAKRSVFQFVQSPTSSKKKEVFLANFSSQGKQKKEKKLTRICFKKSTKKTKRNTQGTTSLTKAKGKGNGVNKNMVLFEYLQKKEAVVEMNKKVERNLGGKGKEGGKMDMSHFRGKRWKFLKGTPGKGVREMVIRSNKENVLKSKWKAEYLGFTKGANDETSKLHKKVETGSSRESKEIFTKITKKIKERRQNIFKELEAKETETEKPSIMNKNNKNPELLKDPKDFDPIEVDKSAGEKTFESDLITKLVSALNNLEVSLSKTFTDTSTFAHFVRQAKRLIDLLKGRS